MTGRMWIATDPSTRMYLKVHQRVSFVFQETDEGLKCSHIHCSNPYQEMMEGEMCIRDRAISATGWFIMEGMCARRGPSPIVRSVVWKIYVQKPG